MRHAEWMHAAEVEYDRLHGLLSAISDEDWARPTDCDGWDVREVVAHLVGAAEATASLGEARRQQRLGKQLLPGQPAVDGMNAVQVRERASSEPKALVDDLASAAARGIHARRRMPALVRALRVPFGPPLGFRSIGYLMDCIYTRDAWMHRVDLSRATGQPLMLSEDHDKRIVADVVHEWRRSHGRPFDLTLTGQAGGRWHEGAAAATTERIELDAVEFCRLLSGRGAGSGLLAHRVPF